MVIIGTHLSGADFFGAFPLRGGVLPVKGICLHISHRINFVLAPIYELFAKNGAWFDAVSVRVGGGGHPPATLRLYLGQKQGFFVPACDSDAAVVYLYDCSRRGFAAAVLREPGRTELEL